MLLDHGSSPRQHLRSVVHHVIDDFFGGENVVNERGHPADEKSASFNRLLGMFLEFFIVRQLPLRGKLFNLRLSIIIPGNSETA